LGRPPRPPSLWFRNPAVRVRMGCGIVRMEFGFEVTVFDSVLFAGLGVGKFRVRARKNYRFVHGHADHPAIGPACRCLGLRREEGQRGTVGVDRTGDMRGRARRGEPVAPIARAVGVSEPTARKYARMGDLSPEPPRRGKPESEVLAPHEGRQAPGSTTTARGASSATRP
jgi:hypothetical protein